MEDSARNLSRRSSFDVSPITESYSPSATHSVKSGNSIPVPTKPYELGSMGAMISERGGRGASLSPLDRDSAQTTLTRWDDFSGEPTTNKAGKPAQATPKNMNFHSQLSAGHNISPDGNCTTISGGSSRGRRNYSNRQIDLAYSPKEAWRGASGLHTIINPILDKPLAPGKTPLFPRGIQKNSANLLETFSSRESPTVIHPVHRKPIKLPKVVASDSSMGSLDDGKSKALKTGDPATSLDLTRFARSDIPISGSTPLSTRNPSTEEVQRKPLSVSPSITPSQVPNGHDLDLIESNFRAKMHHMHLEDQPPSRFSATTYATTAYDSPPATPEIRSESPMATPHSSILHRKRPVPLAGAPNSKLTTRKPTPSELSKSFHADEEGRFSKSLPMSPPEAQAVTRVASLEARLDNLRYRRANLKTVLHELTHVVQPSSIAYDMASRQEIKRTVDGLEKELAAVVKEEHETGLQLHRAWKRQDNDSAYENPSLWVKRLAS